MRNWKKLLLTVLTAGLLIACAIPALAKDADQTEMEPVVTEETSEAVTLNDYPGWKQMPNGKWMYYWDSTDYAYDCRVNGLPDFTGATSNVYDYWFDDNGYVQTGWIADTYTFYGVTYTDWYYAEANGALTYGWKKINGVWYYFDDCEGFMYASRLTTTGDWTYYQNLMYQIGDNYYAFAPSGALLTGWIKDVSRYVDENNEEHELVDWYYANASGVLQTGWQKINGAWYYFDLYDFSMFDNMFWDIDGVTYYFDANGRMCTGWFRDETLNWYYANASGAVQTGWQKINGFWYYFDPEMYRGLWELDGDVYWFDASGHMITGWKHISIWQTKFWIYFLPSGKQAYGWQFINGCWYYFDEMGNMEAGGTEVINGKAYAFDENGHLITTPGWVLISQIATNPLDYNDYKLSSWVYVKNTKGEIATDLYTINGKTYGFDEYGILQDGGIYKIDGRAYAFDSNGVMLSGTGWKKLIRNIQVDGMQITETEWVYMNPNGDDPTEIVYDSLYTINGKTYYFSYGTMCTGRYWISSENKYEYFAADGHLLTTPKAGWMEVPSHYSVIGNDKMFLSDWYYFNADGTPYSGVLNTTSGMYYLENGRMAKGRLIEVNGKQYFFGDNGKAVTKEGWVSSYNQDFMMSVWYHVNSSGQADTGWIKSGGKWYYLNEMGMMLSNQMITMSNGDSYYLDASGAMRTTPGWVQPADMEPGSWIYIKDSSGNLANGWQKINGYWYYFRSEEMCKMVSGTILIIDDMLYDFDGNGRMICSAPVPEK